jgi:hypothetical protein
MIAPAAVVVVAVRATSQAMTAPNICHARDAASSVPGCIYAYAILRVATLISQSMSVAHGTHASHAGRTIARAVYGHAIGGYTTSIPQPVPTTHAGHASHTAQTIASAVDCNCMRFKHSTGTCRRAQRSRAGVVSWTEDLTERRRRVPILSQLVVNILECFPSSGIVVRAGGRVIPDLPHYLFDSIKVQNFPTSINAVLTMHVLQHAFHTETIVCQVVVTAILDDAISCRFIGHSFPRFESLAHRRFVTFTVELEEPIRLLIS